MQIWPRNIEIERSSTSHMNDVIDMDMSTFEATSPAVMIGGGVVELGLCNH